MKIKRTRRGRFDRPVHWAQALVRHDTGQSTMTAATSMSAPDGKSPLSHLWRVFWLQGVIPSNLLWAAALWALAQGMTELLLGLFVVLLLYTGWIIPAVWRAAPSARNPNYGVAARGLTVVWGLNTVLVVFFLTLQLVAQ